MEILKNKRILAAIGIICLFLGVVLPYYTFSAFGYSESVSLWGYLEGKIILVLTLANAIFIFKDIIEKYLPQLFNTNLSQKIANIKNPKLSLVPLVLIIIFVIYLNIKMGEYKNLDKGAGFYLLWIGIIAMAAHSIIYKGSTQKNNFDTSTNNINTANNYYQTSQVSQPIPNNTMSMSQNDTPTNQFNPPAGNVKYCPNCGNAIDINAQNCPNCMFKF